MRRKEITNAPTIADRTSRLQTRVRSHRRRDSTRQDGQVRRVGGVYRA